MLSRLRSRSYKFIILSQSELIYLLHCRCRELSFLLITLNDTQSVGLLWTRYRTVAEIYI